MRLAEAVVRVEPAWKMKTAAALPPPSSVSVPVKERPEVEVYTPETRVLPPRSALTVEVEVRPAASRYAAVRSAWADAAVVSVMCVTPELRTPGGNPVRAVPGER